MFFRSIILLTICFSTTWGENAYRVLFEGIDNTKLEEALSSVSNLIELQEKPPGTRAALKKRALADIPRLIKVLHSFAYFNAGIDIEIDVIEEVQVARFLIDVGPQYPFASFEVLPAPTNTFDYSQLTLGGIGVVIGSPAYPETILYAEKALLTYMSRFGYPFGYIVDRQVIADQATKSIHVKLLVSSGPLARFGPLTIEGNCDVKDVFFLKKLRWSEGDTFNPCLITETLDAMEASRLFSSIDITFKEDVNTADALPISIEVSEAKQRSIGAGLSYNTERGPGFTAEWEHRNLNGYGDKFLLNANLWRDSQEVMAQYLIPDFWCQDQDLIYHIEYERHRIEAYKERSFSVSVALDRQLNPCTRFSYGLTYKQPKDTESTKDGEFHLLKTPVHFHWHSTKNMLDPRNGESLYASVVPTAQIKGNFFTYGTLSGTGSVYRPLDSSEKFVVAASLTAGTIIGTSNSVIPPSERFYAGTQDSMRGYKYKTVSPFEIVKSSKANENGENEEVEEKKQLTGGTSLLISSLELRTQWSSTIGFVLFSDQGQVYERWKPDFSSHLFWSVGAGLRYFTAAGPLRFDVAFPLRKREEIDDGSYQFYISVGQAF